MIGVYQGRRRRDIDRAQEGAWPVTGACSYVQLPRQATSPTLPQGFAKWDGDGTAGCGVWAPALISATGSRKSLADGYIMLTAKALPDRWGALVTVQVTKSAGPRRHDSDATGEQCSVTVRARLVAWPRADVRTAYMRIGITHQHADMFPCSRLEDVRVRGNGAYETQDKHLDDRQRRVFEKLQERHLPAARHVVHTVTHALCI